MTDCLREAAKAELRARAKLALDLIARWIAEDIARRAIFSPEFQWEAGFALFRSDDPEC